MTKTNEYSFKLLKIPKINKTEFSYSENHEKYCKYQKNILHLKKTLFTFVIIYKNYSRKTSMRTMMVVMMMVMMMMVMMMMVELEF